jgi:hypothetical protein
MAIVALTLASCDGQAAHHVVEDVTLLRQAQTGDEYPAGAAIGRLVVSDGCIGLRRNS